VVTAGSVRVLKFLDEVFFVSRRNSNSGLC
jgi:hypothetical protein